MSFFFQNNKIFYQVSINTIDTCHITINMTSRMRSQVNDLNQMKFKRKLIPYKTKVMYFGPFDKK